MDRQRGTVKWFSREKGWGFIRLEGGEDIFVHHSDIVGEGFVTLEDGEAVEFSVEEREKGPRAREVRSLDDAGSAPASGAAAAAKDRPASERKRASEPDAAADEDSAREEPDRSGGLRPLAEQLREKLGRHFPGLGS
ncbi:MAG: cold-shock protein [Gemmatimonadota bacterium]